jgi:hypothetical protein
VDPFVVIIGGMVMLLLLFAVGLGLWHPRSGRQIVGRSLRNEEAEAEIEAHDIEQMIAARNRRRRLAGKPEIGDELAEQALRPHDHDD